MEELRSTLESDSVYKESKEYVLNATIDIDTKLSNGDTYQQRPSNSTQNEAANLNFPHQIPERDGHEECK